MIIVFPSLSSTIILLLAKKKIWLVELTNLTFYGFVGAALFMINGLKVTGEMTDNMRQQQALFMALYFGVLSCYVNPSWLLTFVTRVIMFEAIMASIFLHREAMDDEYNFFSGFITSNSAVIILESARYLNTKQKLKLFVRMKKSQQQEKQLAELLDAVPDCVLICSKDTQEQKP